MAIALGSGVVQAQEKTAAAASPDGIGEARQEFEAIKSTRDAALLPKSELPRVAVPELHGGATPPAPVIVKPRQLPSDAKSLTTRSPNWLIEAMEKQNSRDNGLDRRSRDRQAKENTVDARAARESNRELAGRGDRERGPDSGDERDPQRAAALNPLTRYLETWMTPQDYSLLKPGLTESLMGVKDATGFGGSAIASGAAGIGELGATPTKAISAAIGASTPRENPFLQTLKPDLSPTPSLAKTLPTPLIAPPAAVSAVAAPPPLTTVPPGKALDFGKPSSDDKYFKQLKRF